MLHVSASKLAVEERALKGNKTANLMRDLKDQGTLQFSSAIMRSGQEGRNTMVPEGGRNDR